MSYAKKRLEELRAKNPKPLKTKKGFEVARFECWQEECSMLKAYNSEGNILAEYVNGFWINYNKQGNHSFKRARFYSYPRTELIECELCGKKSTPKKVHYRSDVANWNDDTNKGVLCAGCWNKVRPIVRKEREYFELRAITSRLYRETLKCQQSKRQAS